GRVHFVAPREGHRDLRVERAFASAGAARRRTGFFDFGPTGNPARVQRRDLARDVVIGRVDVEAVQLEGIRVWMTRAVGVDNGAAFFQRHRFGFGIETLEAGRIAHATVGGQAQ